MELEGLQYYTILNTLNFGSGAPPSGKNKYVLTK